MYRFPNVGAAVFKMHNNSSAQNMIVNDFVMFILIIPLTDSKTSIFTRYVVTGYNLITILLSNKASLMCFFKKQYDYIQNI